MENNAMPPSSPQQPYIPLHPQSTNHWKTFAIVLLIVFIGGIALLIFKSQLQSPQVQNITQQKPAANEILLTTGYVSQQTEQNQLPKPPSPKSGLTINKVFYTKYYPEEHDAIANNLFVYDDEIKTISQLTNYTEPLFYISNIRVVDENSVGFLRCSSGDYADCGIYVIDITSKKITEKKKLERQMLVNTLEFASLDNFAYFGNMRDKSKAVLKLILFDQGILKTLEQIDVSNATGRGGIIADAHQIQFSQDKQHLLQIDTSARSTGTEDFNIYIYNLSNGDKQIIENATHPQWVNNTTIVYRKYVGGGVYLYDIVAKTYKKIDAITQDAYYLSMLQGTDELLFTDYEAKQLWLYNFTTKENKKILDGALDGFWLTPTKIVYNEVRLCTQAEQCGMLDYKVLSVSIFDIEKMMKIGSIPDRSSDENFLYNMTSYYSSES
ncbi:MAG TPA: hypothetical protein VJB63_02890 [Patescibacteria group bacterium]|nr:hypothetical protein [Patescibacteria group bacterium]